MNKTNLGVALVTGASTGIGNATAKALQSAGFRVFLALPALLVSSALGGTLFVAAFLGWFAALFTGRMPRNLRQAQLLALRYSAQLYAYGYLLTDRYPYASPAPPVAAPAEPMPAL